MDRQIHSVSSRESATPAPEDSDDPLELVRQLLFSDTVMRDAEGFQDLEARLTALEARLTGELARLTDSMAAAEGRAADRHEHALREITDGLRALADRVEHLAARNAGSQNAASGKT